MIVLVDDVIWHYSLLPYWHYLQAFDCWPRFPIYSFVVCYLPIALPFLLCVCIGTFIVRWLPHYSHWWTLIIYLLFIVLPPSILDWLVVVDLDWDYPLIIVIETPLLLLVDILHIPTGTLCHCSIWLHCARPVLVIDPHPLPTVYCCIDSVWSVGWLFVDWTVVVYLLLTFPGVLVDSVIIILDIVGVTGNSGLAWWRRHCCWPRPPWPGAPRLALPWDRTRDLVPSSSPLLVLGPAQALAQPCGIACVLTVVWYLVGLLCICCWPCACLDIGDIVVLCARWYWPSTVILQLLPLIIIVIVDYWGLLWRTILYTLITRFLIVVVWWLGIPVIITIPTHWDGTFIVLIIIIIVWLPSWWQCYYSLFPINWTLLLIIVGGLCPLLTPQLNWLFILGLVTLLANLTRDIVDSWFLRPCCWRTLITVPRPSWWFIYSWLLTRHSTYNAGAVNYYWLLPTQWDDDDCDCRHYYPIILVEPDSSCWLCCWWWAWWFGTDIIYSHWPDTPVYCLEGLLPPFVYHIVDWADPSLLLLLRPIVVVIVIDTVILLVWLPDPQAVDSCIVLQWHCWRPRCYYPRTGPHCAIVSVWLRGLLRLEGPRPIYWCVLLAPTPSLVTYLLLLTPWLTLLIPWFIIPPLWTLLVMTVDSPDHLFILHWTSLITDDSDSLFCVPIGVIVIPNCWFRTLLLITYPILPNYYYWPQ